jgi:DNA-binding MarR family transcriptional regulator
MGVNVSEPKVARGFPVAAPSPLFLRDEELTRGIELLDLAHRGLIGPLDRVLSGLGLGRNHQRLLYFVGRHPGITMVELGSLVPLTKQSLSRLLKDLVGAGLVDRTPNPRDRRQRLLRLSPRGRELDDELNGRLRQRLGRAYRAAGAEAVAGYHQVLSGLIDERARRQLRGAR